MTRTKLILFHSATGLLAAYAIVIHDVLQWLWSVDVTHMTFAIMAIYVMCSVYVLAFGDKANFAAVKFQGTMFPVLGILGTIIGLAIVGFSSNGDQATLARALIEHLGALFLPTGFGVGFLFLLGQQLALCIGEYE